MQQMSREKQIQHGIEQLAFSWEYIYQRNKFLNGKKFVDFMSELTYIDPDDENSSIPPEDKVKLFSGYRNVMQEEFQSINIAIQQGEVTWSPEDVNLVFPIAERYLKSIADHYDATALQLLLKNISYTKSESTFYQKGQKLPGLALYYMVVFRYAVKFRIPVRFIYREVMGEKSSERYIMPLSLACRNGYVDLVGVDLNEPQHGTKQFILSCIEGLGTDFYEEFNRSRDNGFAKPAEFDYDEYKKTAEYRFRKPLRDYRIQMWGHTYHHFCHSYLIDHKVVEHKSDKNITVQFQSSDWRSVAGILINYAGFSKLISDVEVNSGKDSIVAEETLPENCGNEELPLLCRMRDRYEKIFK